MTGDQLVANLVIRAGIMEDLGAAVRMTAVAYRGVEPICGILATLAGKLDMRAHALNEEAREMAK